MNTHGQEGQGHRLILLTGSGEGFVKIFDIHTPPPLTTIIRMANYPIHSYTRLDMKSRSRKWFQISEKWSQNFQTFLFCFYILFWVCYPYYGSTQWRNQGRIGEISNRSSRRKGGPYCFFNTFLEGKNILNKFSKFFIISWSDQI